MNLGDLMPDSEAKNDFERLVELCSSYGLNQQQTNQIISDFKNGSFACHDQSIDQSFQHSIRDMEIDSRQSHFQHTTIQQYSFKYRNGGGGYLKNQAARTLKEGESAEKMKNSAANEANEELIECFINERRELEKNFYSKLENENKQLREVLKQKNEKIDLFMKMKVQDSEIILGLKDSLTSLTKTIQDKEERYQQLFEKYEKVKMESENLQSQKSLRTVLFKQDSASSFEDQKTQAQNNGAMIQGQKMQRKSSQKYIRDITSKTVNKSVIDSRDSINKQNQDGKSKENSNNNKRLGVDIGKYKGMIQKLRSSYQFR